MNGEKALVKIIHRSRFRNLENHELEVLDPKKMAKTEFSCKIGTLPGIR